MAATIPSASERRNAQGLGWFLGWHADVQLVYMDGRIDDASYELYLAAVASELGSRSPDDRISVFYHLPQPAALSSWRRTRLAQILKAHEEITGVTTLVYAMATPSAVVRAGLRMLFWLAPPPYDNVVVSTPAEGLSVVASRQGVDYETLRRHYEERLASFLGAHEP